MHADRPIYKSTEDRFGRSNFAKRIAQVIARRGDSTSLVLGIHAPWGEGKSSVLNMIAEELEHDEGVLIVPFNPWRFPDEVQLLHKFFSTLAVKFDKSLRTRGEKLSGIANKYADVLSPIPWAGGPLARFVKEYGREHSDTDLETLRKRMEEILAKSGKRIVVFMDDIDRLDNDEIHAIFRLVKLSADFPNTTYLLAFDEKRVSEALGSKYGSFEAGRNFLEKIIQVPLPLPPASVKALRAFAVEGINSALDLAKIKLSDVQEQRFVEVFDKAFLRRITTPRVAKRFANGLTFVLPITTGEVDGIDIIFLEALRAFYPSVYLSVRENQDIYSGAVFDALSAASETETKKEVSEVIDSALEGFSEEDNKAARIAIQALFPRTGASGLFGAGAYGERSDWKKEKRTAAKEYLARYYNYGVPPDDISDREIEEFIERLTWAEGLVAELSFKEMISNDRANVLISKLRLFEDELPPDAVKILARILASNGDNLPLNHPTDRFFGLGAYAQTSMLLRHLVQSLTEESDRDTLAVELAEQITPLPLAFEYSKWIRPLKRDEYSDEMVPVVSAECEAQTRSIIAQRIAKEAETKAIEYAHPLDAQQLYQFWFAIDPDSLRSHLSIRLQSHPEQAARFVAAVVGISPTFESDEEPNFPQQQEWYELLGKMIDPEVLAGALQKIPTPSSRRGKKPKRLTGAERAANWFLSMKGHSNDSTSAESTK